MPVSFLIGCLSYLLAKTSQEWWLTSSPGSRVLLCPCCWSASSVTTSVSSVTASAPLLCIFSPWTGRTEYSPAFQNDFECLYSLMFILWMLLPWWSAVLPGGNAVLSCREGLLSLWHTVVAAFFATACYWLTFNFWSAVTERFLPGPLFPFPLCSCLGMLWSFIPVYPCPSFSFAKNEKVDYKVSSEAILWHILSFSAWSSLQIKD